MARIVALQESGRIEREPVEVFGFDRVYALLDAHLESALRRKLAIVTATAAADYTHPIVASLDVRRGEIAAARHVRLPNVIWARLARYVDVPTRMSIMTCARQIRQSYEKSPAKIKFFERAIRVAFPAIANSIVTWPPNATPDVYRRLHGMDARTQPCAVATEPRIGRRDSFDDYELLLEAFRGDRCVWHGRAILAAEDNHRTFFDTAPAEVGHDLLDARIDYGSITPEQVELTVRVFCVDRRTLDVALVYSRRNRCDDVGEYVDGGEYVGLPLENMYDTGIQGNVPPDLRVDYEPQRACFSVEFRVPHDSLLVIFQNRLGFEPIAQ
jgi:hypothetical protein